jgi:hypothetical protein
VLRIEPLVSISKFIRKRSLHIRQLPDPTSRSGGSECLGIYSGARGCTTGSLQLPPAKTEPGIMAPPVTYELLDGVGVIRMDDGKMNAFGFEFIKAFNAALDEAEKAPAIMIIGNKKALSAGFDLSVMGQPPCAEVAQLFKLGSGT